MNDKSLIVAYLLFAVALASVSEANSDGPEAYLIDSENGRDFCLNHVGELFGNAIETWGLKSFIDAIDIKRPTWEDLLNIDETDFLDYLEGTCEKFQASFTESANRYTTGCLTMLGNDRHGAIESLRRTLLVCGTKLYKETAGVAVGSGPSAESSSWGENIDDCARLISELLENALISSGLENFIEAMNNKYSAWDGLDDFDETDFSLYPEGACLKFANLFDASADPNTAKCLNMLGTAKHDVAESVGRTLLACMDKIKEEKLLYDSDRSS